MLSIVFLYDLVTERAYNNAIILPFHQACNIKKKTLIIRIMAVFFRCQCARITIFVPYRLEILVKVTMKV